MHIKKCLLVLCISTAVSLFVCFAESIFLSLSEGSSTKLEKSIDRSFEDARKEHQQFVQYANTIKRQVEQSRATAKLIERSSARIAESGTRVQSTVRDLQDTNSGFAELLDSAITQCGQLSDNQRKITEGLQQF